MRSGVIEGVRISLGEDGLLLLHRFYVVESRGEVYERDDHPMQIANHVVKNMGDGHMQPRPIFALRRFKRNKNSLREIQISGGLAAKSLIASTLNNQKLASITWILAALCIIPKW
jgi:hypothetical protein